MERESFKGWFFYIDGDTNIERDGHKINISELKEGDAVSLVYRHEEKEKKIVNLMTEDNKNPGKIEGKHNRHDYSFTKADEEE